MKNITSREPDSQKWKKEQYNREEETIKADNTFFV